MDIRSALAAQSYAASRPATQPAPSAEAGSGKPDFLEDFAATLEAADHTAQAAMAGDADPQSLVEALAQSQLAVETAVTLRDKMVEAYQEILRMPV
jgi:flagellar hook-basal body complex protein FliE